MRLKCFALFMAPIICLSWLSCSNTKPEARPADERAEAARKVGEAYMNDGDYTMALKELLKAAELNSNDPYIHNDLGLTYMAKKRLGLAVTHFQKAIALKDDFSAARNNLGSAYMALENWDAAIALFNEVLEDILYTTPHFAQVNLGWAYFNKKNYQEAEKYYKAALFNQPKYVVAMRGLARVYMVTGRAREAIELYERALKITPRFVQLYLDVARAYRALNQREAALDAYRKVIAIAPDSRYADEAKREAQLMGGRDS